MEKNVCKECIYYIPNYGVWCFNGWSKDGKDGYCHSEPEKVYVEGNDVACKRFISKK